MNSRNEAKINMYTAVSAYLSSQTVVITTIPAFPVALVALDAKIAEIRAASLTEAAVTEGITISKGDLKKSLCDSATSIAAAVFASASASNDVVLKEKARYSFTDLYRLKDEDLQTVTQNLHNEANGISALLVPYGITAAILTGFQTAITNYSTAIPGPRNATSQRAASSVQINTLIEETDEFLKEQVDRLALQFKSSNPEFYAAYKYNRIIIDPGTSTTKITGKVVATGTDNPVSGAVVSIVGKAYTTVTDLLGNYTLVTPDPGTYEMKTEKSGFTTNTQIVIINLGTTLTVNVEL